MRPLFFSLFECKKIGFWNQVCILFRSLFVHIFLFRLGYNIYQHFIVFCVCLFEKFIEKLVHCFSDRISLSVFIASLFPSVPTGIISTMVFVPTPNRPWAGGSGDLRPKLNRSRRQLNHPYNDFPIVISQKCFDGHQNLAPTQKVHGLNFLRELDFSC